VPRSPDETVSPHFELIPAVLHLRALHHRSGLLFTVLHLIKLAMVVLVLAAVFIGAIWWILRKRFEQSVPAPFSGPNVWRGRWMSRKQRGRGGRLYVLFPPDEAGGLPEGTFEAEALAYYELFGGLFWAANPLHFKICIEHERGFLSSASEGAAAIARIGARSAGDSIQEPDDVEDDGLVEFHARLTAEGTILGDFRAEVADDHGSFVLHAPVAGRR